MCGVLCIFSWNIVRQTLQKVCKQPKKNGMKNCRIFTEFRGKWERKSAHSFHVGKLYEDLLLKLNEIYEWKWNVKWVRQRQMHAQHARRVCERVEANLPCSLRTISSSCIIIIYILLTVNAHRFLHPYAKETESNHFTMLHPFWMCMWLLLNCIVGGKSPSFPLLFLFHLGVPTSPLAFSHDFRSPVDHFFFELCDSLHARFTFIHLLPVDIIRWWIHIIHKMIHQAERLMCIWCMRIK